MVSYFDKFQPLKSMNIKSENLTAASFTLKTDMLNEAMPAHFYKHHCFTILEACIFLSTLLDVRKLEAEQQTVPSN
jgi:hypothetical protein